MSLQDIPRLYTVILPNDGTRNCVSREALMMLMEVLDSEKKRYMVAVG